MIYPLESCVINKLIFDCPVWVLPAPPLPPPLPSLPVSDYLCLFCSSFVFFSPLALFIHFYAYLLFLLFLLPLLHFHVYVGVTLTAAAQSSTSLFLLLLRPFVFLPFDFCLRYKFLSLGPQCVCVMATLKELKLGRTFVTLMEINNLLICINLTSA